MKRLLKIFLIVAPFFSLAQLQDTTNNKLQGMSLAELMNVKITVSKTNLSSRETPSIVSVITRNEIKNMGARDLTDILNQVPGFSFGSDVENIVGVGTRGNWGHEGKVLLLIDGNEMNEILFATTQFGQHYDISNIDRIEIIRGPGSSIYGGYAELGVINIVSRKGQQMKGINAGISSGLVKGANSRSNLNLNMGGGSDKLNYSFSALYGQGIRSNGVYTDIYGTQADMRNVSALRPMMLNGNLTAGNLSVSMIYDGYHVNTVDQYDQIYSDPVDQISFSNFYSSVKYDIKPSLRTTITPRINYKTGTPWKTIPDSPFPYSINATRISPGVNVNIEASSKVNLVFGLDSYFDAAKNSLTATEHFSSLNAGNSVSFHNIGVYGQSVFKFLFGNITLGARVDNHSQFGSAFSPRIGFTKAWSNFHLKALYSRAFRSPAIENMNLNPQIKPERTGVTELELGYKFGGNMFLTTNAYYIIIKDPIVYYVDAQAPTGSYGNFDQAGSVGFEIDYRIKYNWGYISTNYAYYSSYGINKVPYYNAPRSDKSVLGLPSAKFNLSANFKLTNALSVNPSASILSNRQSVTGIDVTDNYEYSFINGQILANLFLRWKNKTTDFGIGVYNILDEKQVYVQAYSGGHAPLPGLGRELMANLSYTLPFK